MNKESEKQIQLIQDAKKLLPKDYFTEFYRRLVMKGYNYNIRYVRERLSPVPRSTANDEAILNEFIEYVEKVKARKNEILQKLENVVNN